MSTFQIIKLYRRYAIRHNKTHIPIRRTGNSWNFCRNDTASLANYTGCNSIQYAVDKTNIDNRTWAETCQTKDEWMTQRIRRPRRGAASPFSLCRPSHSVLGAWIVDTCYSSCFVLAAKFTRKSNFRTPLFCAPFPSLSLFLLLLSRFLIFMHFSFSIHAFC